MTDDELEKIKKACADAGYKFVGIQDGKIVVSPVALGLRQFPSIKEAIGEEFESVIRPMIKKSPRVRHGKRPKFGRDS